MYIVQSLVSIASTASTASTGWGSNGGGLAEAVVIGSAPWDSSEPPPLHPEATTATVATIA